MRRLVYLDAARRDLVNILRYVTRESGSVVVGRSFTERLRQQCAKLALLPGQIGTLRPELMPDIRSFAFKGYVIFFRYEGDRLLIVSIIEGHRDIDAYFSRLTGRPND